jgi:hypothetical protein
MHSRQAIFPQHKQAVWDFVHKGRDAGAHPGRGPDGQLIQRAEVLAALGTDAESARLGPGLRRMIERRQTARLGITRGLAKRTRATETHMQSAGGIRFAARAIEARQR